MTIWNGITEQGAVVPIQVDAQGRVVVSGGTGPGTEVYGTFKAFARVNTNGSLVNARNLTVSRLEAGRYSVTITTPLPTVEYLVLCSLHSTSNLFIWASVQSTTNFIVGVENIQSVAVDAEFSVGVLNDQPEPVTPLILPKSAVNEIESLKREFDSLKKTKQL